MFDAFWRWYALFGLPYAQKHAVTHFSSHWLLQNGFDKHCFKLKRYCMHCVDFSMPLRVPPLHKSTFDSARIHTEFVVRKKSLAHSRSLMKCYQIQLNLLLVLHTQWSHMRRCCWQQSLSSMFWYPQGYGTPMDNQRNCSHEQQIAKHIHKAKSLRFANWGYIWFKQYANVELNTGVTLNHNRHLLVCWKQQTFNN